MMGANFLTIGVAGYRQARQEDEDLNSLYGAVLEMQTSVWTHVDFNIDTVVCI